ncbi:PqiC family protein [Desulfobulbus oligotrophicus]|uniref:Membrane integrity-associated transporter subunit PqiC n=1 Tax=Desulfobulbus oligotrophicus TaxID=1909699 RepID=A0A7T5VDF3_9BACT|nr:PqiC family protein [Desulfobulbus oligotrophicus]QQG65890.1 membrane integrity-associated transporter subunit PqiC [Desulfobulbus oligotrophicus]
MNKFNLSVLWLILGTVQLGLLGCGPAVQPISYHTLTGFPAATETRDNHSQLVLQIGPVNLPDRLKQSRLVFGTNGTFQFSDQHRWADDLDHDIARAIGEQLAVRLKTEQIALFPENRYAQITCQIVLDVLTLEGLPGQEASFSVRWSIIDPDTRAVRFVRRSTFGRQPTDSSQAAWVATQRQNIAALSEEIARAIQTGSW